ncbi:cytochrome c biogenesis heme-transporting ATPase CcmA [Ramlibacter sp.]|uniref:cytochrome c biogenesis heme-transporting ATPase CcmA n=1 Tax=Ramlibacter sp. TaxID=1917967 RepID=UPI0026047AAC|nr:cytochrome c biogenesis heme-transporting ATPase CcmA [Ramlibacter sp.]MDB5953693.1 heme exporter protein CcmA [Ramlibacter sp.]
MLTVHGLTCVRGTRPLFAGLDFAVEAGSWAHVRGANGSGKTSLLRLLAGLAKPEAGDVRWNGERVGTEDFRRELIYLGHHAAVKEDLTARENLCFAASLDGVELAGEQAGDALARFGLAGREDLPVRHLSAGQKRRVLLARTVTRAARLWILDEPFTALDTKAVEHLSNLVANHVRQGGLAVLTSHQAISLPAGQVVEL